MSSRVVGFNGERLDPVGGAIHLGNGHRAYEPVLKRFDQPDSFSPFGRGGINPYAYCAGDPVNRADPSGHMSWQAIAGIASGVVGLALVPFTLGQSLTAAACVLAGLETASGLAAILSGALEDADAKLSSALGWAALAAGAASIGGGLARAALSRVPAGMARAWLNGSGRLPRTGARAGRWLCRAGEGHQESACNRFARHPRRGQRYRVRLSVRRCLQRRCPVECHRARAHGGERIVDSADQSSDG
ncbi:hypothetical protein I6K04_05825 [Chromobacterium violaceum]|nr:hypothetical protein I6K04_05825 [Chromobacterium violaceum]QRQ15941.1 hypothetical protein I6K03_16905 [Chromobacterium violaceum]